MSDDWDFYMLLVDDEPASIMVDLGIRSSVPLKSHQYMGYMRTKMNDPRPDGLSSQEEFDKLSNIERAVERAISADNDAHFYVGRNTSSGHRDFYFYTSNLESLHQCLQNVVQDFPQYEFSLGGRKDEAWSTYLDFLYPRPTDHQRMMDRRVCEQLEAKGDDLDAEREIDHRVYFTEKSNLKRYQNYLNSEGFLDIQKGKTKPVFGTHYVDFKHWGAPRQVSDVVYDLYTKAVELGGDYDGWGCSVTKAAPES
jgi:uncharacterized protein (TIGR01619 family)